MTDPQSVNRRDFVRGLGLGALAMPTVVRAVTDIAVSADPVFTHGLASGDPLADRVIIWTRIAPQTRPQTVLWDVARDPGFQQMLRRGRALASAAADWTVKVDVPGLPADTLLYYRFTTLGRMSRSGRTRTLPVGSTAQVKLALFSCSNYPAGFFHVYAEAARTEGLHAVVHVGD